jgi:CelD/BcsL family acetyltransferase involved in cellulose biosynthesis
LRAELAPYQRPKALRNGDELRLDLVHDIESLAEEWMELARRSRNIFSTWDWASVWWRHFGNDRPLLITSCQNPDGDVVAVLPLYLSHQRLVRTIRFLGYGPADELGPVCDPVYREAAAESLKHALWEHCPPWDLFIGDLLPGDQNWGEILSGTRLRWTPSPVTTVDGRTWEQFLESRSSNFRGQVRRRERNLTRGHAVRYRLATDPERLDEDLKTLFDLRKASLGRTDFSDPDQPFHRDFAARALQRGWLRFWLMEVDGRAVAAWYGFRFEDVECYYQAGRDPNWNAYSVGFVLLAHSMREAFNDGVREYRLLRGGEPYKDRFATSDPGLETVGLARTAVGRASIRVGVASQSMPRPAKKLLAKFAG